MIRLTCTIYVARSIISFLFFTKESFKFLRKLLLKKTKNKFSISDLFSTQILRHEEFIIFESFKYIILFAILLLQDLFFFFIEQKKKLFD